MLSEYVLCFAQNNTTTHGAIEHAQYCWSMQQCADKTIFGVPASNFTKFNIAAVQNPGILDGHLSKDFIRISSSPPVSSIARFYLKITKNVSLA